MKSRTLVAGLLIGVALSGPAYGWRAYNDLLWAEGQKTENITTYTAGQQGEVVDFDTGEKTGASVAISASGSSAAYGKDPKAGTDAAKVFGGIVSCKGLISVGSEPVTITVSGLDPDEEYEIVLSGNRGLTTEKPAAVLRVELSDVAGFENTSTLGTSKKTSSSADDTTDLLNGGNNTRLGYVIRFSNIKPGADGDFTLTASKSPDVETRDFGCLGALMLRTMSTKLSKKSSLIRLAFCMCGAAAVLGQGLTAAARNKPKTPLTQVQL